MRVLPRPGGRDPYRGQGLSAQPGRSAFDDAGPVGPDGLDEVALDALQGVEPGGGVLEHERQPVAPGLPPGLGVGGQVDAVEHDPPVRSATGGRSPSTARPRVDLPQPLSPTSPRLSPAPRRSVTPSTARTAPGAR